MTHIPYYQTEGDPLTVGELVDALSMYERGMLVLVDGYEGGYTKPLLRVQRVALTWGGNYTGPWHDSGDGEAAVIVARFNPNDD